MNLLALLLLVLLLFYWKSRDCIELQHVFCRKIYTIFAPQKKKTKFTHLKRLSGRALESEYLAVTNGRLFLVPTFVVPLSFCTFAAPTMMPVQQLGFMLVASVISVCLR